MKISIITPVLNEPRVDLSLDSVISQQHDHEVELLVIDGGSTDGTLEVLQRYQDQIAVLVSERDAGIFDGMNKGIARASGEVLGILNADDRYSDPFVLRDVMEVFGDERIEACYGNLVYANAAGEVTRYWKAVPSRRINWHLGWAPPHPTFFARRRVYEKYGAFDPAFPVAADYELMLRFILKHGVKTRYLDRVMVNMAPAGNANRSVAKVLEAKPELSRAWRRNQLRGGWFVPMLRLLRRPFQFIRPRG